MRTGLRMQPGTLEAGTFCMHIVANYHMFTYLVHQHLKLSSSQSAVLEVALLGCVAECE